MGEIQDALHSAVGRMLSDQNYEQSLAFYRFWLEIGQTYFQIPFDQIFNAVWDNRTAGPISISTHHMSSQSTRGIYILDPTTLIRPTAHLVLRFASDAESDHLAPHSSGLQNRLCTRTIREFFDGNLMIAKYKEDYVANGVGHGTNAPDCFCADTNLIAQWANLGYVEESAIRNHILQSLISHPTLYDHQADALIILFKLAGATFEAYAGPSVVDRCFELLKDYNKLLTGTKNRNSTERKLIQEIIELRERGWEGLPPPPVFTTGKPNPTGANQKDPAATPVATSLGLPNRDLEPQYSHPPPLELVTTPEIDTIPASPVTQSPSISIATLSDFAIADTSDDESPIDPTAATPHETFYLEDGNVEVLCGNTLFRVHIGVLSFHSPTLRRMFAQTNLATAESPNDCPRILSSDTATDFATLLKTIYLPGFPERNKVPDFATFSSLLRITAKYEMPTVRSQVLEVVRDAYPKTFEGLAPSKPLGEDVFSGPTPHPNAVLNLFIQQKLTSALPMAYYMAIRRGPDSLMDRHLPRSATLPPEVLQSAIRGFVALREVEFNGTQCLVFGPKSSHPCSTHSCPSRAPTGPAAFEAYQKVFDRIVGSSQLGTKVLQVPEFYEDCGDEFQRVGLGVCGSCVERWETGHAELRKKAWAMLPDVFGLKG